jgi:cell division protein FtsN
MGTGASSMAESDNTVELLKDIRDEIRGARNELRDEIRGVRTERVEHPDQARRRRLMLIGFATGVAAFVVCLFLFRGAERAEGDKRLAAEHVVAVEATPPPPPSLPAQTPEPSMPVPTPSLAVAPVPVAPAPRPIAATKRASTRHKAAMSDEELEPAKL